MATWPSPSTPPTTHNAASAALRSKPPPTPPAFPAHKDKAKDAEIAEDNHQHKALLVYFVIWHNADAILRNLLIAAVPTIFLAAMRNPVTGFGNVSCMSLLDHIRDVYGHITEKDLEQNIQCMRTQWQPPTEDGVAFDVEGIDEPTKPTVLQWADEIISFPGHFEISCREWRHMETTTKTWTLFKSHFKAANIDIRSRATSGTAGYHCAPYAAANSATTREADLLASS
jgi:hypothetical protein